MQSELKPCPFCGSDKHMLLSPTCDRSTPYNPADRAFPIIRCGGCYTDVPGRDFDASGKSAVEAWNRRSALSDQERAVEVKDGGYSHDDRVALATCLSWDLNEITPSDVKGILERLEIEGYRLVRSALVDVPVEPVGAALRSHLMVLSGYHITNPPTPDHEFVQVCNGDLRKVVELLNASPPHREGEDSAEVIPADPTEDMIDAALAVDWECDGDERAAAINVWHAMRSAALAATRSASATSATSDNRIAFGLVAQGHIPAVEAALAEGADWQEIGRRIGWDGETAKAYYERHLARSASKPTSDPNAPAGGIRVELPQDANEPKGCGDV